MTTIFICACFAAFAQTPAQTHSADHQCPMMEHSDKATLRGDKAMGFSHEKTTHHFRLASDGGAIEVEANDASDETTRAQIRAHLTLIAQMFAAGDFNIPMFIHDQTPPGSATMQRLKKSIDYTYQPTGKGALVRIATKDDEALAAIHEFLRFQIVEHKTGDPLN